MNKNLILMSKMHFRFVSVIIAVMTVLLFISCKKEPTLEEKIADVSLQYTKDYLKEELRGGTVDSVTVSSFDSLNRFDYCTTSLNFLQEFEEAYQAEYESVEESGDEEALSQIKVHLAAVHEAQDYYTECLDRFKEDDKDLILYLVKAKFYVQGRSEPFFLFLTPDLKVHAFNPLDSSPLD